MSNKESRNRIEDFRKKEASSISFAISSSPFAFASTLTDKLCDNAFSCTRITFKGSLPHMPHFIVQNFDSTTASRRVAIADYLFCKGKNKSDVSVMHMLMISLIDKKVDTFKKYVDLTIKKGITIDFPRLFYAFLELSKHTDDNIDFLRELIRLINHIDANLLVNLFKAYQNKFVIRSDSNFVSTILETMSQEMRDSLCIVPHVKDLTTLNYLLGLGYSIDETDEKGDDILFNLVKEETFFLGIPEENLFAYLIDNMDLSKKDGEGHSALYYAIGKINTVDEYRWSSSTPCTKYELLVTHMITNMKPEDVCTNEIIVALEAKSKGDRESIDYSFVYTHHKSLMAALVSKGFKLSDFILSQIFDRIYTDDSCSLIHYMDKEDVDDTLNFIYGSLDKDTNIQKDNINNKFIGK